MATRLWTPADMVGVTGLEYFDSTQNVELGTAASGVTPVSAITAVRPSGGTSTRAASTRDDYRPSLGSVNGQQSIYFGPGIFRLPIATPTNLPSGTANKFWFFATKVRETRTGDYYPFGYGQDQRRSVTWKMRQGSVPAGDFGNNGYNVGSAAVAASGISILVEAYRESGPLTRGWYNGQASASTTATTRPVTNVNAGLGYWPQYGNGTEQDFLRFGYGYGEPSDDDLRRLEGWLSWNTGDNGASLASGHAYKTAAPTVSDGAGSAVAPDSATQAQTSTSLTLASRAGVQPDSAAQAVTASSPTLAARSTVAPDSASQASTASSPSLVSQSAVTPDNAAQQQAATSPALASRGAVAPDSATQAAQASSPTLSNVRTAVAPDSAAQTQATTQPSLAGAGTVTVDSATQVQTASSPTVMARSTVQPASAGQTQATTSPSLNGRQSVAPDSAVQASTISSPTAAARATLIPNSASQQQPATSPTLAAKAFLLVSSALQTQAATSPALFVGERPLPPSTRTVRSIRLSRVARSPRPSRLAA